MVRWVLALICLLTIASIGYCTDYDQARRTAHELSRAGDRVAAAKALESAIGNGTDATAEWLRGYVGVLRDVSAEQVARQFLRMADMFPASSHSSDALLRAGCLLEKAGGDPVPAWLRVAKDYPRAAEAPEALLRLGYRCEKLGSDPEPDWRKLVGDHPDTKEAAEALHCLGHLALRRGDPDAAIKDFEQSAAVPAADPTCVEDSNVEAGYAYISRYWKTHDMHCATQAISALAGLTRSSATREQAIKARLGRGEAFLILSIPERAAQEYQAAIDLEPNDPYLMGVASFELSYCYCLMQSWDKVFAGMDHFLASIPGEGLVNKDASWRKARPDFARLVMQDPVKASGLTGLDLVPEAAYWKALALYKLRHVSESQALITGIDGAFHDLAVAPRFAKLKAEIASATKEGR